MENATVARKASVDSGESIMRHQQLKHTSLEQGGESDATDIDPLSTPTKDLKDLALRDEDNNNNNNNKNSSTTTSKDDLSLLREAEALPQTFTVKYLGKREARGLWGIKHTRRPVDEMVSVAKSLKPGSFLPFLHLRVGPDGVTISEMPQNQNKNFEAGQYPIDVISYGVQDLVYTRVFAMIIVRGTTPPIPGTTTTTTTTAAAAAIPTGPAGERSLLECHAFVCDGRQNARRLTFALATAFRLFSQKVKSRQAKPFAIDLRSPEEIQAELKGGDGLDSEA